MNSSFENTAIAGTQSVLKEVYDVAVFGLGFVGLPLALSFSLNGYSVIGVDISEKLVEQIDNGVTHHLESHKDNSIQKILQEQIREKRFRATTNADEALRNSSQIIITVGIPIIGNEPSLEPLEAVVRTVGQGLQKGDLVLLRSTVIPGTTGRIVLPILEEESGLVAGKDFYLAYSSERIAEGSAFNEFENMPTLVAGINKESLKKAKKLLRLITKAELIEGTSIEAVETCKVFENIQRDVNIAMVQEFARFTEASNLDIFEIVRLANTHKRVNLLSPGPGVGGYCIPNAIHYLEHKANDLKVNMPLLNIARNVNNDIPKVIVRMLEREACKLNKPLTGLRVAILGIAMKDYSNDDRSSPAVTIIEELISLGVEVKAYDKAVPTVYTFKVDSIEDCLTDAEAILILAKQKDVKYSELGFYKPLMGENPIIIDTRDVIDLRYAKIQGFVVARI